MSGKLNCLEYLVIEVKQERKKQEKKGEKNFK